MLKEIARRLLLFAIWVASALLITIDVWFLVFPVLNALRRQWSLAWGVSAACWLWILLDKLLNSLLGPIHSELWTVSGWWLVGAVALVALWAVFGSGGSERAKPSHPRFAPLLALLLGPLGLAQALQRRWMEAYLLTAPMLLLYYYASGGLHGAARTAGWILFAILWLAAIWDAWDTQRKARQEQPAGEGSPSPA